MPIFALHLISHSFPGPGRIVAGGKWFKNVRVDPGASAREAARERCATHQHHSTVSSRCSSGNSWHLCLLQKTMPLICMRHSSIELEISIFTWSFFGIIAHTTQNCPSRLPASATAPSSAASLSRHLKTQCFPNQLFVSPVTELAAKPWLGEWSWR